MMPREIEFIAWFCGEMHDDIVIVDLKFYEVEGGLGCPLNTGIQDFISHDDPDAPMKLLQYIGCKDKNGAKGYDGNIINHPTWGIGVIEWGDLRCGWVINYQKENSHLHNIFVDITVSEIIGHILTHPELMEEPDEPK